MAVRICCGFFSLVHSAHLFKQFAQAQLLRAATLELGGEIPAATWVMLGLYGLIFSNWESWVWFFPLHCEIVESWVSLQWFVSIFRNLGRWYEGEKPITWCFLAGQKLYVIFSTLCRDVIPSNTPPPCPNNCPTIVYLGWIYYNFQGGFWHEPWQLSGHG